MLRTAAAALLLVVASYSGAHWLTHDFQVWTAEGARRLEVALQPVAVPAVHLEGPGLPTQPLAPWLAAQGKVTVLDFIYTRCETICLSLGSVFQQMQADLQDGAAAEKGVRLLSMSFDGAYDTPDRLAAYAHGLGADPALWQFARVPNTQESAALLRRLQVVVVPDGRGDFEHNAALLVLDPQGRMVRVFDIAERELALNYALHVAAKGAG